MSQTALMQAPLVCQVHNHHPIESPSAYIPKQQQQQQQQQQRRSVLRPIRAGVCIDLLMRTSARHCALDLGVAFGSFISTMTLWHMIATSVAVADESAPPLSGKKYPR